MRGLITVGKRLCHRFLPPGIKGLFYYIYKTDYTLSQYINSRWAPTIIQSSGGHIPTGPFQGMRYLAKSSDDVPVAPKLLGTYEREISSVIEECGSRGYEVVVNIGAAEGYYAVGMARKLSSVKVICFESRRSDHAAIRSLAALNNVNSRIDIQGTCTTELLNQTLALHSRTLIICDIEGGESLLLDPSLVPLLAGVDILVELHDFLVPGVTELLKERFAPTHLIQQIESRLRTIDDWPSSIFIPEQYRVPAMWEGRPPQCWMWLKSLPR